MTTAPQSPSAPAQASTEGARTSADRAFTAWLRHAPTVWLLCRDKGHWWPGYDHPASRWGIRQRDGATAAEESCQRTDHAGETCPVRRRRFFGHLSWVTAGGAHYMYPPFRHGELNYQVPEDSGGGWSLDKRRRGMIRAELDRRRQAGENVE